MLKHIRYFFVVYLFIVILSVVFAVIISNVYENLVVSSPMGSTLKSYTASTFIMLNLPVWVTIIGFIGAILLFASILRDREQGGSF